MTENALQGVAAVVGAGTMGGGIAADLANAGWTVHLLDVSREAAAAGRDRVLAARPPLLFLPEFADRIAIGDTTHDLECLAGADWVVEAVAESPEIKRAVLSTIEAKIGPQTIVTSNTSGLGLAAMSAHCSAAFRCRFFGTHFLNPPRYLKLLEVIPTAETDPKIVAGFVRFAEQVLGHRVVIAKDTPGFISTRLWVTHLLDTIHTAEEMGITVETVDALTGPLVGRPRSATFRMADVVGLDIIAAVAANQHAALPNDPLRERLQLPASMRRLLDSGHVGEKAGAGFYKREGKEILALDLVTGEYRPRIEPPVEELLRLLALPMDERFDSLAEPRESGDGPAVQFLRTVLPRFLEYCRVVGPLIADDVLTIDRTIQWGFGWEVGPFAIEDYWTRGRSGNYGGTPWRRTFRTFSGEPAYWPDKSEYIDLAEVKTVGGTERRFAGASLVDLGGKVFCLEFTTKLNTLNPEVCEAIHSAISTASQGAGLVIGNQGPHFSAGYDLSRLLRYVAAGDLDAIDAEMRACQQAFQAIKYASIPVVAAVHGYTLGGGCECALHCRAIQAAPELSMGLPELRVGLVPCGGGCKEMLIRALERLGPKADPLEAARAVLRMLVLPRHSANAYEARRDGWLRPTTDAISRNADRRLYEAKQRVLALAAEGYRRPDQAPIPVTGAAGLAVLREDVAGLHASGALTDYDAVIADRIAVILCGGEDTAPGHVPEQILLDLERRVFLELCRRPETLDRIRHLLETGKPLRNGVGSQ